MIIVRGKIHYTIADAAKRLGISAVSNTSHRF